MDFFLITPGILLESANGKLKTLDYESEATDTSVPKYQARNCILGNLPRHIQRFIQERRRLMRTLRRTGDPDRG